MQILRSAVRRCALLSLSMLTAMVPVVPAHGSASEPGGAAAPTPQEVLVLGGTGLLGADIVRALADAGARVTVFARPTSDRKALEGLPVGFVTGDLRVPADIDAALAARRYDAVVVAVRVEDGDPRFYATVMPPLARAARAHGVKQVIHHGAVGAGDNAAKFVRLGWERVPGLLERLRDQGDGEAALRASGVPFTIIRNARVYPPGTPATGAAVLTEDDTVLTPVTRADLARLTLRCLGAADCLGRTFHVSDPTLAWPPPRPSAE